MDKYLEVEHRLAELLGWKIKRVGDVATGWYDPAGNYRVMLPQWCRDWSACGPLMVEHDCYPRLNNRGKPEPYVEYVHVLENMPMERGGISSIAEDFVSNHADRDACVRYVIVMAVIAKLEAGKTPS